MPYNAMAELGMTGSDELLNALIGVAKNGLPDPIAPPTPTVAPIQPVQIAEKKTIQPVSTQETPVQAAPIGAATPKPTSTSSSPNWNSLTVGQMVNGAEVLDANAFFDQFLKDASLDGMVGRRSKTKGGGYLFNHFGSRSEDDPETKALGRELEKGTVTLLGYKPKFKGTGQYIDNESGQLAGQSTYNIDALTKAAKQLGIDVSKYFTKHTGGTDPETGLAILPTPDTVSDENAEKLQRLVNHADMQQYISNNPNAMFSVNTHRPGKSGLKYNTTTYVRRGDRLVPVQSDNYKKESFVEGALKGSAFVLSAALMPALAPALGGGIIGGVASGALGGAVNAGINGGNILKGAALGGLGGGVASGAGSLASAAGASADLAKIVGGVASGATKGLVTGGNIASSAALGGLGSTNFAGMADINLGAGNSILNNIVRTQIGTKFRKRG